MTSMDWSPGAATTLYQAGTYDAFPNVAYAPELGRTVTLWKHSVQHGFNPDGRVWMAARKDSDEDGVWSTDARPAPISGLSIDSVTSIGTAGVTWSTVRRRFYSVLLRTKKLPSGGLAYSGLLISSADGLAWQAGPEVAFAGTSFFYVSHILEVDGELMVAAYCTRAGDTGWSPAVVTSADGGASWSAPTPIGAWSGSDKSRPAAEPRLALTPSGRLVATIRNEPSGTYLSERVDGVWSTPRLIVPGVSGQPSMICITDDVWMMLYREYARRGMAADKSHGATGWAFTTDAGATWTMAQGDPTVVAGDPTIPPGRPFMYGDFCRTKDSRIQAVISVEDSRSQWGTAMIMSLCWRWTPLVTRMRFERTAPAVSIAALDPSMVDEVTRTWTDPASGIVCSEHVRLHLGAGADRAAWDFEAPQGVTVTYSVPSGQEATFSMPDLPEAWLIHPMRPRMSAPIEVVQHDHGDAEVSVEHVYVPGRRSEDGRTRPVSVTTGHRHGDEGTIRLRTRTLESAARLDRLLADGFPLLLSAHAGADLPRWISIPKRAKARRWQYCGDEVREWTLSYVEVDRPDTYDMPLDLRIKDLDYTYLESTGTIDTGSPELLDQ